SDLVGELAPPGGADETSVVPVDCVADAGASPVTCAGRSGGVGWYVTWVGTAGRVDTSAPACQVESVTGTRAVEWCASVDAGRVTAGVRGWIVRSVEISFTVTPVTPTAAVPTTVMATSLAATAPAPPAVVLTGAALVPTAMLQSRRNGIVVSQSSWPTGVRGLRPTNVAHSAQRRRWRLSARRSSSTATPLKSRSATRRACAHVIPSWSSSRSERRARASSVCTVASLTPSWAEISAYERPSNSRIRRIWRWRGFSSEISLQISLTL